MVNYRRSGAILVSFAALLSLASCAAVPPPPLLVPAASTAGLRVRISPTFITLGTGVNETRDAEDAAAKTAAQQALVERLRDAGYVPVDSGPYDLSAGTWYAVRFPRREDPAFARARVRLRDATGQVVDDITLEFRGNVAPLTQPNTVAVSLVNEMTKSPKLVAFAVSRVTAIPTQASASNDVGDE